VPPTFLRGFAIVMSNAPVPFFSIVPTGTKVTVAGHIFNGFMSHVDSYHPVEDTHPVAYLTSAAAIGVTREEVDVFVERLRKTLGEFLRMSVDANQEIEEQGI